MQPGYAQLRCWSVHVASLSAACCAAHANCPETQIAQQFPRAAAGTERGASSAIWRGSRFCNSMVGAYAIATESASRNKTACSLRQRRQAGPGTEARRPRSHAVFGLFLFAPCSRGFGVEDQQGKESDE